jgi:rare lipoprotein A
MVIRRESSEMSSKSSLRIWLLAGASSVVLIACVVGISTRTVLADAMLSRSSSAALHAAPAASATPATLAPQKAEETATTAHKLKGIASWYGSVFNGRHTASGERFNMYAMTACHPTLPFGSVVRVVNLENHRSVVVRITDHGELLGGRVIDLSYAAAKELSMAKGGLASVKLEILSLGGSHRDK